MWYSISEFARKTNLPLRTIQGWFGGNKKYKFQ